MTWDEFKKEVDRQIKEKGITDTNIHYIDFGGFDMDEVLAVAGNCGLAIS